MVETIIRNKKKTASRNSGTSTDVDEVPQHFAIKRRNLPRLPSSPIVPLGPEDHYLADGARCERVCVNVCANHA